MRIFGNYSILTKIIILSSIIIFAGCNENMTIQSDNITTNRQSYSNDIKLVKKSINETDLGPVPNQYIVIFKDKWDGRISEAISKESKLYVNNKIESYGISKESIKSRYENAFRGFTAKLTNKELKLIEKDPSVKYIVQDHKYKALDDFSNVEINQTKLGQGVNNVQQPQITPWGITRVGGPYDGSQSSVGKAFIMDTGVANSWDLNWVDGVSFVPYEGENDLNGHGTFVAGIIAAIDNNINVVGVAAGATVESVKILNQNGEVYLSWFLDGVDYIAIEAENGDVVNMSFGFLTPLPDPANTIRTTIMNIADSGVMFTIAAGNYGIDAANVFPANINHSNVYTLSAFDQNDNFATAFSNFGNPPIDYSEPGVEIISLSNNDGVTGPIDGTSFAAPHAAGILLMDGAIQSGGYINNDVDGNPDIIGVGN